MGKKYLDTKESSLEQSVLGIWQSAVEKTVIKEASGDKEAYQKFFNATLKKFGVKSPAELKGEDKKKFYDAIDAGWEGDNEKKEEVELDEVAPLVGLAVRAAASGAGAAVANKAMNANKNHKKKKKEEEVEVKEGKMSQLHQLIKDKKTAEEIAKIMRVDVKTIKTLMAAYISDDDKYPEMLKAACGGGGGLAAISTAFDPELNKEALEWGTDKLRKHTEDVTPGQQGDWFKAVNGKNESMRETLARVWNTTEDKNPFKKESKKDLTKEVKSGKTMTGKKVASVDINPIIKEKTK